MGTYITYLPTVEHSTAEHGMVRYGRVVRYGTVRLHIHLHLHLHLHLADYLATVPT
jgi:hypothetical protein